MLVFTELFNDIKLNGLDCGKQLRIHADVVQGSHRKNCRIIKAYWPKADPPLRLHTLPQFPCRQVLRQQGHRLIFAVIAGWILPLALVVL